MILTDKDAHMMEENPNFKSVELGESMHQHRPTSPDEERQLSLFEAKKLN